MAGNMVKGRADAAGLYALTAVNRERSL